MPSRQKANTSPTRGTNFECCSFDISKWLERMDRAIGPGARKSLAATSSSYAMPESQDVSGSTGVARRSARAGPNQGNLKPGRRSALWSNVRVKGHPARVPSAVITASANEPCPSLSAIMAVKTSCSFSTTSTSA